MYILIEKVNVEQDHCLKKVTNYRPFYLHRSYFQELVKKVTHNKVGIKSDPVEIASPI